jgi:hypothetical protein
MLPLSPTDFAPTKAPDYHWSPANQRAFLEALATSGNISESAKAVSMSGQAAYALCNRAAGRVFRLGWDAAVLVARRRVEGELLERALAGQEEVYERDPDTGRVTRTRIHNGTTMAMLTRLDRMASGRSDTPADTVMAQIVAQDFERFLDLVEAGGGGAEAMLFLKARDGALVPMAGFDAAEFAKHYQLSQNSNDFDDEDDEPADCEIAADEPELTPGQQAAKMSVWFCQYAQEWRTNFPPPDGFLDVEDGEFGEQGYERALDDEEQEFYRDRLTTERAPLREAGEAARRAWFGLGEGKNFAQSREDPEEGCEVESPTPSLCHPRENGDPGSEIELENQPIVTLEGQAMDPRVREDDKNVTDGNELFDLDASGVEPETDGAPTPPSPPPDNPNIRVIHCKPQINYAAHGMIPPHIARALGLNVQYDDEE